MYGDKSKALFFPFLPKNEGITMTKEELLRKISELESVNDQLQTELRYLDYLLKEIGFAEGLKTLKFAAKEIIEEDTQEKD